MLDIDGRLTAQLERVQELDARLNFVGNGHLGCERDHTNITNEEFAQCWICKVQVSESLLFRLARHVRNTDDDSPIGWGAQGIKLLIEVQALEPERYEREVKRDNPACAAKNAC